MSAKNQSEPTPVRSSHQVSNLEIPDSRFQVFHKSLLEHEYLHEEAFISASIHRVQHGIYRDDNKLQFLDSPSGAGLNVTLVAITFVFHPMNSFARRFKRAQISIQGFIQTRMISKGSADSQALRIIKFAPHVAYGRISTQSLHWNFSLGAGASIGVQGATLTPSSSCDHAKIMGTMLKIQGSTRTARNTESGKLVWSVEENEEQAAGLPREFTFVFLMEKPAGLDSFVLQVGIKPTFSGAMDKMSHHDEKIGITQIRYSSEMGQNFPYTPFNFAAMKGKLEDLVELPGLTSNIQVISPQVPILPDFGAVKYEASAELQKQ